MFVSGETKFETLQPVYPVHSNPLPTDGAVEAELVSIKLAVFNRKGSLL